MTGLFASLIGGDSLDFTQCLLSGLPSFTGFSTGFLLVSIGCSCFCVGFTGFQWVLLGFYWVFTGFYWLLLGRLELAAFAPGRPSSQAAINAMRGQCIAMKARFFWFQFLFFVWLFFKNKKKNYPKLGLGTEFFHRVVVFFYIYIVVVRGTAVSLFFLFTEFYRVFFVCVCVCVCRR